MANYIWNKLLLKRTAFNETGIGSSSISEPFINSFRCFFESCLDGSKDLCDFGRDGGIAYDQDISCVPLNNEFYEIMFATRTFYPVFAIVKTIEQFHYSVWYAVEENAVYVSKFCLEDCQLREYAAYIEEDHGIWLEQNFDYAANVAEPDCDVWHYMNERKLEWKRWDNRDIFKKYATYTAADVGELFREDFIPQAL
jgi:hypothetical protein